MNNENKILWINEGEILLDKEFRSVVARLTEDAKAFEGVVAYWWSESLDARHYCDVDCYNDEGAAMDHLRSWDGFGQEFMYCADVTRALVLGDVPESVKKELEPLRPHFMDYYGGFVKDKAPDADPKSDILWSLEGKIIDKKLFKESMNTLTAHTEMEQGSLMHWWCVDKDDNFFVLERYADTAAAMEHLNTWTEFGQLFLGATSISKYRVYSDLSEGLMDAIASLNPQCMRFMDGFAR